LSQTAGFVSDFVVVTAGFVKTVSQIVRAADCVSDCAGCVRLYQTVWAVSVCRLCIRLCGLCQTVWAVSDCAGSVSDCRLCVRLCELESAGLSDCV
jgi:hypothetical protein